MPWEIVKDHPECGKGKYAVVKEGGKVEACHPSEADAKKHMSALYAKEPSMKNMPLPASLCTRSVFFTRADNNSDEPTDGRTLEGYAAVFDTPTRIASWEGTFDEQIAKGAFKRSIKERMPKLQFDHGRDKRTGSVPIGAINEVREDDHGLYVNARLFDNPVVEPIRQAIEAGAIDGMSFRFEVEDDEWRDKDGKKITKREDLYELLWNPGERGPLQRTIKRVKVHELGPVVFPAYDATSVGVRSLLDQVDSEEREALIREVVERLRAPQPPTEATHNGPPKEGLFAAPETSGETDGSDEPTRSEEEGMTEEIRSDESTEEPENDAGQSDTRSADGSATDEESREDEASNPVSPAVLKAEAEDERRKQARRIRDAQLRKIGIVK